MEISGFKKKKKRQYVFYTMLTNIKILHFMYIDFYIYI